MAGGTDGYEIFRIVATKTGERLFVTYFVIFPERAVADKASLLFAG